MQVAPKPKNRISKIRVKVKGSVLSIPDDPFLLSEFQRTFPSVEVLNGPFSLSPIETAALAKFPGSRVVSRGAAVSSSSPSLIGLGFNSHNLLTLKDRLYGLLTTLEDFKGIEKRFRAMKMKEDGKYVVLYNPGEQKKLCLPSRGRWNSKGGYARMVRKRLFEEMDKHRELTMLTLTFDPELVQSQMPDWWVYGVSEWLAVAGGLYLNDFLKRLRKYRERGVGQRWNYLGHVVEVQKNGNIHYHVIFFGNWIAPIGELKRMWGGSHHDAGVDVSKPSRGKSHKALKHYISKYLTKTMEDQEDPSVIRVFALMWRYKIRTYNISHEMRLKEIKGRGVTAEDGPIPEKPQSAWVYCDYCYRDLDDEGLEVYIAAYFDRERRRKNKPMEFDFDDGFTEEIEETE